jgi:hypothetical protein
MQITLSTIDHAAASREARFEARCCRIDPGDGFGRSMELLQARISDDIDPSGPVLA